MGGTYLKYSVVIGMVCILLLLALNIQVLGAIQLMGVTINSDGIVMVNTNITVAEGLNQVSLPIEPIPETITIKQDGKDIPPIYYKGTLIIPVEKAGTVRVEYLANVSVHGGKIVLGIGNVDVILKVMKGVVLLSMPDNVIEAKTKNGILILRFTGPTEISYTITKPPAEEIPETQLQFPMLPFPIWMILLSILAIIIIIIAIIFLRRKPKELGHLDKAILDILREKGGKALQTELITELKIPKTTLWRHVKKLEALGYIEIEQIGRVNVIKLK